MTHGPTWWTVSEKAFQENACYSHLHFFWNCRSSGTTHLDGRQVIPLRQTCHFQHPNGVPLATADNPDFADCDTNPGSHHLVLSASVVWTELATSQDCRRLKISKHFRLVVKCDVNWVMWTESCLVLTLFPVRNMVTDCDVVFGNWVKTSSQMHSHSRRDWIKLFSLLYTEDYWKLSVTVANSVHTTDVDEMRQSCLVGVGGVNYACK